MGLFDMFKSRSAKNTDETVDAVRAVRRVAEAVSSGKEIPRGAARTVERVLAPPLDWQDLLRPTRVHNGNGSNAQCR